MVLVGHLSLLKRATQPGNWWYTPLILCLRRQAGRALRSWRASLIYKVSSTRTAWAAERNHVRKKGRKERKGRKEERGRGRERGGEEKRKKKRTEQAYSNHQEPSQQQTPTAESLPSFSIFQHTEHIRKTTAA